MKTKIFRENSIESMMGTSERGLLRTFFAWMRTEMRKDLEHFRYSTQILAIEVIVLHVAGH